MILGIGIDLCQVSRIERCCASATFLARVFSVEELAYAGTGLLRSVHLAAAFAAREAFAKASGLGLARLGLKSISVTRDSSGRPMLSLSSVAQLQPFKSARIHLSISHDGDYAVAVVVIEEGRVEKIL